MAYFPEYFVLPLIVVLLPLYWVRLGCLGQTLRNEQAIIACDPESADLQNLRNLQDYLAGTLLQMGVWKAHFGLKNV